MIKKGDVYCGIGMILSTKRTSFEKMTLLIRTNTNPSQTKLNTEMDENRLYTKLIMIIGHQGTGRLHVSLVIRSKLLLDLSLIPVLT